MYEWLRKNEHLEERERHLHDQDVWAWKVIGLVALGTSLIVWVPVIMVAMHA